MNGECERTVHAYKKMSYLFFRNILLLVLKNNKLCLIFGSRYLLLEKLAFRKKYQCPLFCSLTSYYRTHCSDLLPGLSGSLPDQHSGPICLPLARAAFWMYLETPKSSTTKNTIMMLWGFLYKKNSSNNCINKYNLIDTRIYCYVVQLSFSTLQSSASRATQESSKKKSYIIRLQDSRKSLASRPRLTLEDQHHDQDLLCICLSLLKS